ncbi:hypothetical protein HY768_10755 [candidate division TA06 bacterium]|uniref:Uncharacterized protein n=1 Tax=candidate division TA06 bacterium TaxID=2250710 RepID=A0A933ID82_UNCT6|nr:hypothetical protein [candidate division TA06 bacterium]
MRHPRDRGGSMGNLMRANRRMVNRPRRMMGRRRLHRAAGLALSKSMSRCCSLMLRMLSSRLGLVCAGFDRMPLGLGRSGRMMRLGSLSLS